MGDEVFSIGGIPVDQQDRLVIEGLASIASLTIVVGCRVISASGEILQFEYRQVVTSDRVVTRSAFLLGPGRLISVVVRAEGASPLRGRCFVTAFISRQASGVISRNVALFSDYLVTSGILGWPGGAFRSSIEGPGAIRVITGTNPAAGADFAETVPTGALWELLSFTITIVTDATAGNRTFDFEITDGTTRLTVTRADSVIAASTTVLIHGVSERYKMVSFLGKAFGIPEGLFLPAGFIFASVVDFLQAGDDLTAPVFTVREWLEPA